MTGALAYIYPSWEGIVSDPSQFVGTVIGAKYSLNRLIGVGGMGAVYEGTHLEIGKRVAIKVMSADLAQAEEVERRFRREARAASAVESEHIVQVFDAGRDETVGLFMVMEFLVGEDLGQRVARSGAMPVEEVVEIACQSLRGLFKAHVAGVVHRDLKPANLFLTKREDGSPLVKLVDFGVSKILDDAKGSTIPPQGGGGGLTRLGSAIGTPQYMSPEQAQGLATVDHRTDVWSMGAVLHELLCGEPAYKDLPTYEQTIIHIVTNRARPLREVAPWVMAPLAAVVDQMLVHEPEERITIESALAAMLDLKAAHFAASIRYSVPDGGSGPAWSTAGVSGVQFAATGNRPNTSAAVVLGPATDPDAPAKMQQESTPPRASDLPGVASSRKILVIVAAVAGVAVMASLGVWLTLRPTGAAITVPVAAVVPSGPVTLVSSGTAAPAASASPPSESAAPIESSEPPAVAAASSAAPVATAPAGGRTGGSSREPKGAKANTTSEKNEPPDTPPAATKQYGGVGVSDSY